MTGWITGTKIAVHGTEDEVHYWPPPEWVRIDVTLDDIQVIDLIDLKDLEFHVSTEGLIIIVTDMDDEVIGTITETFEDIVARLTGVSK